MGLRATSQVAPVFNATNMQRHRPVIGVPADRRLLGSHWFQCDGEKYLAAITDAADALPLIIPVLSERLDREAMLDRLDGVLLTGSPSNVEPVHYQGPPSAPGTWHDPHRDATTLPLVRTCVDAGIPLLAVCRGFQEMNVAYGGTLHQRLHEIPGFLNHKADSSQSVEAQYGPAHAVALAPEGRLAQWAGASEIQVNSLHSQGIDRLGEGLRVEARAPDGVIEAISVIQATAFAVAVQWHPEWQVMTNSFSKALFTAFGDAARGRMRALADQKRGGDL